MHKRIESIINWVNYNKTKTIVIGSGLVLVVCLVTGAFVYFNYKNNSNNVTADTQLEEVVDNSDESEDIENLTIVTVKHANDNFTIVKGEEEIYNGTDESAFYDAMLGIMNEEGSSGYKYYYDNGSEKLECVVTLKEDNIVLTLQNNSELVVSKGKEIVKQESEESFNDKKEEVQQNASTSIVKNPVVSNNSSSSTTSKPSNSNNNNSNSNNNTSNSKPSKPSKPSEPSKPVTPPTKPETPKPEQPKPPVEKPQRTWQYMDAMSNELFNLMNDYRIRNGIHALKYDAGIQAKAKVRAELNASREGSGHDRLQISITTGLDDTPREFLQRWIDSPNHNSNLLDKDFTRGGVAIYKDSNDIYYIVAGIDMDF